LAKYMMYYLSELDIIHCMV